MARNRQRRNPPGGLTPEQRAAQGRFILKTRVSATAAVCKHLTATYPMTKDETRSLERAHLCLMHVLDGYDERTEELKVVVETKANSERGGKP